METPSTSADPPRPQPATRSKDQLRLSIRLHGGSGLNDATALTTLTVAVAAVTSGHFSWGKSALILLIESVGGLAAGIVVALVIRLVRTLISDAVLLNAISLGTPFAAYLLGESVHVSGVLAVVVAGLMIGHDTSRAVSGASRLQTGAVWRLVDFILEGLVFLLIGQQLPQIVRGLRAYETSTIAIAAAVTVGIVVAIRPLWLVLTQSLPRSLHLRLGGDGRGADRRLSGREVVVLSWSGTRGVISLAAAFSLPLTTKAGEAFPARDLVIFCTYLVVLVTLIGQGVTLAPLTRMLGLRADLADQALLRNEARAAAITAAMTRLKQLVAEEHLDEHDVEGLRARLTGQLARAQRRIATLEASDDDGAPVLQGPADAALAAVRRAVIEAQRTELLAWRDAGRLPDISLRILERELDHEEHALPGMNDQKPK